MNDFNNLYKDALCEICQTIKLDFFPQIDASDLLYRVITLEDIYLPLTLEEKILDYNFDYLLRTGKVDDAIALIDEKIAFLEAEENANEEAECKGNTNSLYISLEAEPGGGKSTFCKRLTLALLKRDANFFNKYNDISFSINALPVFLTCNKISNISLKSLKEDEFFKTMYKLFAADLSNHNISEAVFKEILSNKTIKCMLIIDGWDEILDEEKETEFKNKLDDFISKNPAFDVLITKRVGYQLPEFSNAIYHSYSIAKLSDEDVELFCKKWCNVIFSSDSSKQETYKIIFEQLIKNKSLESWWRNPFTLSLLLTATKNDSAVPENKADLLKKLVDLYIFWSTKKHIANLSAKSITLYLEYIACFFAKHKKSFVRNEELIEIIKQCHIDIGYKFSQNTKEIAHKDIIKELLRTGILVENNDCYSFSGLGNNLSYGLTNHRQVQEFLAACAIVGMHADEEYNYMYPEEIFADKYKIPRWQEIIIFSLLLSNSDRLREKVVSDLLNKARIELDNYSYTNLLFSLVIESGPLISPERKKEIYDVIFKEHITDRQIQDIIVFIEKNSYYSENFESYIDARFKESVENGGVEYGFPKATIEAMKARKENCSPFDHAENLLFSEDIVDIIASTQILLILAWCKYAKINNVFNVYYQNYKMPSNVVNRLKGLLVENVHRTDILKSLKDCILANFLSFGDIFNEDDVMTCIQHLSKEESANCEIVLSLAPVDDTYREDTQFDFPQQRKEKYIEQLKTEIAEKEYDKIIFTFNLCTVIGCWTNEEQFYKMWSQMDTLYSKNNNSYIGKARYDQISIDYKLYFLDDGQYKVYFNDPTLLSSDALGFLNVGLESTQSSMNNLSYLLRRHEVIRVEKTFDDNTIIVSPEDLLSKGVADEEPFSMINYALSVSGTFRNVPGYFDKGLTFLKESTICEDHTWNSVAEWWLNLAIEGEEIEGLIVIYWLIELELLKGLNLKTDRIVKLIKLFKGSNEVFKGVDKRCIDILESILEKQSQDSNMTFTVVNDEGKEVECEVLFTFESEETGKDYIVYTDNTLDEDGNTKVFASIYEPNAPNSVLMPIETEKEWAIIETILEELQNQTKEERS